jgi:hypothetical protein
MRGQEDKGEKEQKECRFIELALETKFRIFDLYGNGHALSKKQKGPGR